MSEAERVDRILDAAYRCFARHGVRRTTMDDIAAEAGMSRPTVYQYVRNKDDAFRRLAARLYGAAIARAEAAAEVATGAGNASGTGPPALADRVADICEAKLELTLQVWRDSVHAAELMGTNARLGADLDLDFTTRMRDLLTDVIATATRPGATTRPGGTVAGVPPGEVAELALALTRGLEADLSDPDRPRLRLRAGIALLIAGLTRPEPH